MSEASSFERALAEIERLKKTIAEQDVKRAQLQRERDALRVELDILKPDEETMLAGMWHPCSGCHEFDEGHATGPYSETLRCNLGSGCTECGGIGAAWEYHGELKCCPRFSWGDGTHDPDCPGIPSAAEERSDG